MPFSANGQDFIIEGTAGEANANGSFRNVYYSGSISLYNYTGPTNYGYVSFYQSPGVGTANDISRWPFALSITNSVTVGDLAYTSNDRRAGPSSLENGYAAGAASPTTRVNNIDRWPFAASITNAADVGDLSAARGECGGAITITNGFGYCSGGDSGSAAENVIDRFPFALSITNATDVGDLIDAIGTASLGCGQSSTHGYQIGGDQNTIQRWPFALSITNAADVGDLTISRSRSGHTSSTDFGYSFGGSPQTPSQVIDRFPFALSITNAVNVGSLSDARERLGSAFSSTYGYSLGGAGNIIDRWPFSLAITNASDVGDIAISGGDNTYDYPTGNQY